MQSPETSMSHRTKHALTAHLIYALLRVLEHRVVLRRGRLSVSPATGLTGLLESVFLGDFFGCFGFLALVSERQEENRPFGSVLYPACTQSGRTAVRRKGVLSYHG